MKFCSAGEPNSSSGSTTVGSSDPRTPRYVVLQSISVWSATPTSPPTDVAPIASPKSKCSRRRRSAWGWSGGAKPRWRSLRNEAASRCAPGSLAAKAVPPAAIQHGARSRASSRLASTERNEAPALEYRHDHPGRSSVGSSQGRAELIVGILTKTVSVESPSGLTHANSLNSRSWATRGAVDRDFLECRPVAFLGTCPRLLRPERYRQLSHLPWSDWHTRRTGSTRAAPWVVSGLALSTTGTLLAASKEYLPALSVANSALSERASLVRVSLKGPRARSTAELVTISGA